MKSLHVIIVFSVCSIVLLTAAFILLSSMGPLEQNGPARELVTEILSKDPKVQRNAAKGRIINHDQTTTEILSFLNPYKYYLLIAIGFSVLLNVLSLTLLKYNRYLAGGLLMCAAIVSFFTIIPPVLQAFSGFYLIKTEIRAVDLFKGT